jgi:hypothetical protein
MNTVIFVNPITGKIEQMPVAMVAAYVPYSEELHLEDAAKVAAVRDDEAATNLLLSIVVDDHDTEYRRVITPPEFVPA